jgi:hypothetical protein
MVYQDNILITLNSKIASYNNSTKKSDVSFKFLGILKEEDDIIRTSISIINAQIPASFYVINSTNNKLGVGNSTTSYILTIPIGNYNSYTLGQKLVTLFTSIGMTVSVATNSLTGIMTFTQSNATFFIYPNLYGGVVYSTIGPLLGLGTTIQTGLIITLPFPVNLLGVKKISVKSNALAINALSSTTLGYSNIICTIPCDVPYFNMINYVNTTLLNTNILKTFTINNIDIQLTDEDNVLLDFNNIDWTISLSLTIERVDKIKDYIKLNDIVKPMNFNFNKEIPINNTIDNNIKPDEELKLLES